MRDEYISALWTHLQGVQERLKCRASRSHEDRGNERTQGTDRVTGRYSAPSDTSLFPSSATVIGTVQV